MTFEFTWTHFWITLVLIAAVMGAIQGTCAYLILLERKIAAWAQDRVGPNRVGPWGLLQPIADGVKFLLKEQVVPGHVDKLFYFLGPAIAVSTALLAFAVVPFGQTTPAPQLIDRRSNDVQQHRPVWPATVSEEKAVLAADRAWAEKHGEKPFPEKLKEYNDRLQFVLTPHADIGMVFVLAVGSLAAYAIVLGGWSSNNKYSLLGSLRSSAQLISYEIPMGLSVLGIFLVVGSLNVERIIDYQVQHGWSFFFQPVAWLLFVTSIFAECNRVPFDLPEAEQELVGGYHTEYSGMKFAMYFLGEYTHMVTTSFLMISLFFGGWHLPFGLTEIDGIGGMIVKVLVFALKMGVFILFYMFIRWTIPRFRFDQLMGLAWKVMMPLALVNLLVVLFVKHFHLWEGLTPIATIASLIVVAAATVGLPRPPTRANITYEGHPVTGRILVK